MSSFRKVNLSQEELNKNPYKVSAQPSTSINKSEEKNKPQEDINVNDSRDIDRDITPSQQHFENSSQDEVPPGRPIMQPIDDSSASNTDNSEMDRGDNSYDMTGIDINDWYFPEGDLPWINY